MSDIYTFEVRTDGLLVPESFEPYENEETGHVEDGQLEAFLFFDELPQARAVGVDVVDGEHPGSDWQGAILRWPIDRANAAAAVLGVPVRFVHAGGGT